MAVMFDIETTSLRPYDGQVTLIGMKKSGEIKQWKLWEINDEGRMIVEAVECIMEINESIIGYNNLKFDVPYMLERSKILGKWKPEYFEINYKKWFDLYQYLGNDYRSLKLWELRAGIERDYPELDGKDMPLAFEKLEYEKIEQHNKDDLKTSEKLFNFLKKKNPDLLPFD